jgi:hypothetical protein
MSDLSEAESPHASSEASLTLRLLFGILMRVEADGHTGIADLRTEDGGLVGRLLLSRGRLCFAIPPGASVPCEPLVVDQPDPEHPFDLVDLFDSAREAQTNGERLGAALLARPGLLPARSMLRREIALNLHVVAAACAGRAPAPVYREVEDDYEPKLTFSPLDIFLETAAVSMQAAPADIAGRVFQEYEASADAALLFARPTGGGTVAFPLAARGLEETSLATAVKLGRTAMGFAAPLALPLSQEQARLLTFLARDEVWVCALSDHRMALVRTCTEFGAGQILGFATSLVRRGVGGGGV